MTLWIAWSVLFGALVALAGAAAERGLGFLGAPRRAVWVAAMVLSCVVPVVFALRRGSPVVDRTVIPRASGARTAAASPSTRPSMTPPVGHVTVAIPRFALNVDPWAERAWVLGSSLVLLVFLRSIMAVHRRRAGWREADVVGSSVLIAPDIGPAVVGFLLPRIVLPDWALSINRADQELMLCHERQHVDARDPLALLAAAVAVALFPWNAPVWWMARRLRLAIEIDCDARVICHLGRSHEYGMLLLAVGERRSLQLPFVAALAESKPFLERRIQVMTTKRPSHPVLASLPFVCSALVAIAAGAAIPCPTPLMAQGTVTATGQTPPPRATAKRLVLQLYPSVLLGDSVVDTQPEALDKDGKVIRYASRTWRAAIDRVTIVLDENSNVLRSSTIWGGGFDRAQVDSMHARMLQLNAQQAETGLVRDLRRAQIAYDAGAKSASQLSSWAEYRFAPGEIGPNGIFVLIVVLKSTAHVPPTH